MPYSLELNARSGQLILFTIQNRGSGEVALDMYQRLHLSQIAFDNAPIWELKLYFELEDVEIQNGGTHVIKNYTKSNKEYKLLFWQHFCDDIVNFIEYRRKIDFTENRYREVGELFDPSEDEVLIFRKYAQLLYVLPIMDEFGNNPVERILNANYEEIISEEFIKWIDDLLEEILFGEENPFPEDPTNFFTYFKCIEKLNAMKIYYKRVNMYLDKLLSFKEYFPDEVRHIIGTAYFERLSRGLKIKDVAPETAQSENDPVTRTSEEVDKLLQNMRKAALYIAAGIKELSKTVIDDDGTDPEKVREIQEQIEKLSDKKVMDSIDFMLEDRNRQMLDQATIHMFEAFRNREVVAEGKVISIEKYVKKRELIKRFVAILYNYKTSLEQGTEIKLENEKIREVL